MVERVFINRMLAYSARKKRAKGPAAYSTLKPETSSDSPSVRSKGERFVSARVETYQLAATGQTVMISQLASCVIVKAWRVKLPVSMIALSRRRPNETS